MTSRLQKLVGGIVLMFSVAGASTLDARGQSPTPPPKPPGEDGGSPKHRDWKRDGDGNYPAVPSLSVTVRDAADELGAAGQDVGKLTDDRARAALASITDRAVGVAHRLDDGLGDGTDDGLDRIDAELQGLIGELARWGVTS